MSSKTNGFSIDALLGLTNLSYRETKKQANSRININNSTKINHDAFKKVQNNATNDKYQLRKDISLEKNDWPFNDDKIEDEFPQSTESNRNKLLLEQNSQNDIFCKNNNSFEWENKFIHEADVVENMECEVKDFEENIKQSNHYSAKKIVIQPDRLNSTCRPSSEIFNYSSQVNSLRSSGKKYKDLSSQTKRKLFKNRDNQVNNSIFQNCESKEDEINSLPSDKISGKEFTNQLNSANSYTFSLINNNNIFKMWQESVMGIRNFKSEPTERSNLPWTDSSTGLECIKKTFQVHRCLGVEPLSHATCYLETDSIWRKFYELGTEMIITKNGRRMYPPLRVRVSELQSDLYYSLLVDIVPVDNLRYRYSYHSSSWVIAGRASTHPCSTPYSHPDGPFRGQYLISGGSVCFDRLKMTNDHMRASSESSSNIVSRPIQVQLHSMHRYQPRIHIVLRHDSEPVKSLDGQFYKTFIFPQTSFIAVTAYQNHLVTKLKIDSNPFAKGFRKPADNDNIMSTLSYVTEFKRI